MTIPPSSSTTNAGSSRETHAVVQGVGEVKTSAQANAAKQQQQQAESESKNDTGTKRHIRPKVRKQNNRKVATSAKVSVNDSNDDKSVKEVTQKMGAWMGLGEAKSSGAPSPSAPPKVAPSSATIVETNTIPVTMKPDPGFSSTIISTTAPVVAADGNNKASTTPATMVETTMKAPATTTGILKKAPKYSTQSNKSGGVILSQQPPNNPMPQPMVSKSKPVIMKDVVVERDPSRPLPPRSNLLQNGTGVDSLSGAKSKPSSASGAVEGYVPKFSKKMEKKTIVKISEPSKKNKTATGSIQQPTTATIKTGHDVPIIKDDDDDETDPLVLASVAELFQAAGEELPVDVDPTKVTADTKVLEADIAFTCMSQEQYQETKQQEKQEQYKVFMGRQDIFSDGDDIPDENNGRPQGSIDPEFQNDENNLQGLNSNNQGENDMGGSPEYDGSPMVDGDDNDDLMDLFMGGDDSDSDEEESDVEPPEPRAFLKLWNVLSEWITPEAVLWLERLSANIDIGSGEYDWAPQVDRSDIGASRCAGLMAMIKMNIPKCLAELGQPDDMRRTAERRLADLLRTFDYSRPMAKLDLRLWRAMTCILLDMVLVTPMSSIDLGAKKSSDTSKPQGLPLPAQVAAVGMSLEEYRYLTNSAIRSLGEGKQ